MTRLMAFILVSLALASGAFADEPKWTETTVSIGEGDGTLYGSYIAPGPWKSNFDAVLILPGSGPTNRDGNQVGMTNDSLKMIAQALGEAGIASIRMDKRGIWASGKAATREEDLRFDTYVDDAKMWLAFLKTRPGVKRVFIIGHSEGALIGAIVAQDEQVTGYVSLAGAGLPAADILRRQLKSGPNGEQVLALAEPTLAKLEKGELDPAPSPILASLFRASVQPYLISWFRYDPRVEIGKIPGRVLIVQGTTDIQVLVEDAKELAAARADAVSVILDGMNHVLKEAPADRAGNIATYSDPKLPLAPGLAEALTGFIEKP